ncbi:alcohol oxidase-like protein [Xylariaceae sp. FL0594]|nr:alcohol oxidase-like protein [Xylariaceae sp. FL0594]
MGLYTVLPDEVQEVDIIIAGGGTAGCIIASRLADADPSLSVLLIEHGPDNRGNPLLAHPLLWRANLAPQSGTNMYYMGKTESQLGDTGIPVAAGGILGGGSCVNLSIYTRPQSIDYDAWKMKGWSAEDLIPLNKKAETYHGIQNSPTHGRNGPIQVSKGPFRHDRTAKDFISAMKNLGYAEVNDLQDFRSTNAVSPSMKYVSEDGKRQDVASAYLVPKLQDDERYVNLHVLAESQVIKVLFDIDSGSNRAVGVEYRPNPAFQKEDKGPQASRTVKARKLVILSCGALGTPGILERSGVGDPRILEKAGIPRIVADLPGVGGGYQDHQVISYHYEADIPKEETSDGAFRDPAFSMVGKLLATNDRSLGWNGFDASAKIRPSPDEVDNLGERFRKCWDEDYDDVPGKPLSVFLLSTGFLGDARTVPEGSHISIGVYNAYPYSRGHVHITGASLDDPLHFATGFLTDEDGFDLQTHVWGYKKQREAARRMALYRGEMEGFGPAFAPTSKAAVANQVELQGDDARVDEIEYDTEDDAIIAEWVRKHVTTCWHGLGTCRMGVRDSKTGEGKGDERNIMAVVDEKLNVYGVQGLKVADLSIAPANVSANTHNTALTIGEKAAEIIIEELGLSGGM